MTLEELARHLETAVTMTESAGAHDTPVMLTVYNKGASYQAELERIRIVRVFDDQRNGGFAIYLDSSGP